MLIAARNDSLSRFTKELKQHQIPAHKKISLNLSTSQRAGVLLNGSSALGSSLKDNTSLPWTLPILVGWQYNIHLAST